MDSQPDSLLAATDQYLRSTPGLVYPQALVSAFPRIANQIVQLKDEPESLHTYFNSLINDLRGGRKGFSFEVLTDIDDLCLFMLRKSGRLPSEEKWF